MVACFFSRQRAVFLCLWSCYYFIFSSSTVVLEQVEPSHSLLCPSSYVLYRCTTNTGALVWRDSNSSQTQAYATALSSSAQGGYALVGVLNTTLVSSRGDEFKVFTSTANLSIILLQYVGRIVLCYDGITGNYDFKSVTIHLEGIPSSPSNLSYIPVSFTDVQLSWSPPLVNTTCITSYQVTLFQSIISSTTSLNVTGLDRGKLYCATVSASDTGGRFSDESKPMCFTLEVPAAVTDIFYKSIHDSVNTSVPVNVSLQWIQPEPTRPRVFNYTVVHNITASGDHPSGSVVTTTVTNSSVLLTSATIGSTYVIAVTPSNALGVGPAASATFVLSKSSQISVTSSSTITSVLLQYPLPNTICWTLIFILSVGIVTLLVVHIYCQ